MRAYLPLVFALLLACTGSTNPDEASGTDTDETSGSETAVPCEQVCGTMCASADEDVWCVDTAAPWHICYDDDFQTCERQDDGSCGWTMVDQEGWDTCVDEARG